MIVMRTRKPLVLVPQFFGCLVFDRRTSRYLPFDREATQLLLRCRSESLDLVMAGLPDAGEREAVGRFFECFYERGFFNIAGHLAADVLEVDMPADHLVGPL